MAGFDDGLDQELYDAIQERRKKRKDMERLDSESHEDNPLGKVALALASGLGGFASGRPGGELATQVMGQRSAEDQRRRELRMKALSQSDDSIKALTDLARIRSAERIAMGKTDKKEEELTDPNKRLLKAPAEVRSKIGLVANTLQNLTDYEQAFAKGDQPAYFDANTPGIGKLWSDTPISVAERQMTETIGRLNSGGVIGKEELPVFRAMVPRPGDTPEIMAKKIQDFRDQMATRLSAFGFQPEELGQIKGFDANKLGYGPDAAAVRANLLKSHVAAKKPGLGGMIDKAHAQPSMPNIKVENGQTYILVGNGTEQHYILPEDLPNAQKDGFQVIR